MMRLNDCSYLSLVVLHKGVVSNASVHVASQEERVRQAIALSLREQQGHHIPDDLAPAPRDSSEEALLAAIAASLAEEDVRR